MIRPQANNKRVHLATFKKRTSRVNRRTVTHRPMLGSSMRLRENRSGQFFNRDWTLESIPTNQLWSSSPRFLLKKDRLHTSIMKKNAFTPRKQLISIKGRERMQQLQDANKQNSLKQIDRMLLSYKMRTLMNLNKQPSQTSSISKKSPTTKKGIVPSQATLNQLREIMKKHVNEVKGGPVVPKTVVTSKK